MPKTYRAKALDTSEWVYGSHIHFTNQGSFIICPDGEDTEYIHVDPSTICRSTNLRDIDNIPLFTHDFVCYRDTQSGIQLIGELVKTFDIFVKELETSEQYPITGTTLLKLLEFSDLDKENLYPF